MTLPKFIITMDGYFRLGMVNQHKAVYRGLRLVYFYDDDREFDVSQELQIEYYD